MISFSRRVLLPTDVILSLEWASFLRFLRHTPRAEKIPRLRNSPRSFVRFDIGQQQRVISIYSGSTTIPPHRPSHNTVHCADLKESRVQVSTLHFACVATHATDRLGIERRVSKPIQKIKYDRYVMTSQLRGKGRDPTKAPTISNSHKSKREEIGAFTLVCIGQQQNGNYLGERERHRTPGWTCLLPLRFTVHTVHFGIQETPIKYPSHLLRSLYNAKYKTAAKPTQLDTTIDTTTRQIGT